MRVQSAKTRLYRRSATQAGSALEQHDKAVESSTGKGEGGCISQRERGGKGASEGNRARERDCRIVISNGEAECGLEREGMG